MEDSQEKIIPNTNELINQQGEITPSFMTDLILQQEKEPGLDGLAGLFNVYNLSCSDLLSSHRLA